MAESLKLDRELYRRIKGMDKTELPPLHMMITDVL